MADEIERKYLVKSQDWRSQVQSSLPFEQAYLSVEPECTVRVRLAGEKGFLTIKGRKVGASAPEFEYEIPAADIQDMMLRLPVVGRVTKRRHLVPCGGLTWEVDEFFDENEGLVIAEIELDHEEQSVDLPDWIGEEVTADRRYANSSLAQRPFKSWCGGEVE